MTQPDFDAAREAKAFRPKAPPIGIAVLANLVLAALCLGVPYYRGHARAENSLRAFSRFAGCLLGASPETNLGLGLPPGERDHFAAQVLRAGKDWPARCLQPLRAIAPDEAIFLWPSVKLAGGDVRAVVALVSQELSTLERQRLADPGGRVPSRPLLALSKLRAALTLYARAAGADTTLDTNAVRFDKRVPISLPARLPLTAGPSAMLDVRAGLDGLRATAIDSRGISWLNVEGGGLERGRIKRTSLVRGIVHMNERPWIVWAMAPERCADAEDHCVRRTTGVALFDTHDAQLPVPRWLAGHPAGRADRSLTHSMRATFDLLALRDAEGALEVRRFMFPPSPTPVTPREDDPPLAASERFELPVPNPSTAVLVRRGTVVYAVPDAGGARAFVSSYESYENPVPPPLDLGRVAGEGAFVQVCESNNARFIAFGTQTALSIVRHGLPPDHEQVSNTVVHALATTLLPETPIALGNPIDTADATRDRLRIACDDNTATAMALTSTRGLFALRCDAERCQVSEELAHDVAGFDAKSTPDGALLVAYAQRARPQVVVGRLPPGARRLESLQTPAPCWDPEGGMCGQPTLVADSGRILLCARDGTDLLALESEDNGMHWKAMSGLQVSGPSPAEESAPMRQHRIRKGLE